MCWRRAQSQRHGRISADVRTDGDADRVPLNAATVRNGTNPTIALMIEMVGRNGERFPRNRITAGPIDRLAGDQADRSETRSPPRIDNDDPARTARRFQSQAIVPITTLVRAVAANIPG